MDYNLFRNKIISHFKDLGDTYTPSGTWTDTQITDLKKKGYKGDFEYYNGKVLSVKKDGIWFTHHKCANRFTIKSNGMTVEIYESSYSEKNDTDPFNAQRAYIGYNYSSGKPKEITLTSQQISLLRGLNEQLRPSDQNNYYCFRLYIP